MSFSFQPGDDKDILAVELERDRAKRQTAEYHLGQEDETPFKLSDPPKGRNPVQTSGPPPSMPVPKAKPHISQSLNTYHGMTREDSNNSIRTVIRDNSSRNSRNSSPVSARPQQGRSASSSEAVTAATRALAASGKSKSRLSSDNGSIEDDGGLNRSGTVIRKKLEGDKRSAGRSSKDA